MSSRDILVDRILLQESDSAYCQERALVWKDLEPEKVALDVPSGFSKLHGPLKIILSAAYRVCDCMWAHGSECQYQEDETFCSLG